MPKWQSYTKQVPFTSFVCKPLPKEEWVKFKGLCAQYRVDAGTLLLAAFLALKWVGRNDPREVEGLIEEAIRLLGGHSDA